MKVGFDFGKYSWFFLLLAVTQNIMISDILILGGGGGGGVLEKHKCQGPVQLWGSDPPTHFEHWARSYPFALLPQALRAPDKSV